MKRILPAALTVLITLCLIVGSERRAWGYVDPGSGFIALQTFASVAAAYLYLARRRIKTFFARKQPKPAVISIPSESSGNRNVA